MFRLFWIDQNNIKREVYPVKGIYVVYELYEYTFQFEGIVLEKTIFIEDEVLDYENKFLVYNDTGVSIKEKKRIFEDYFGFLKININGNEFNFEVRIRKLEVSELEEILFYLWNQSPIIFDNFFSKNS